MQQRSYDDILGRLKDERESLSISQMELCRFARTSQSNYSKSEQGQRRFNFRELEGMCESELDMHYVYTARKGSGKYQEFLSKCSYPELIFFLEHICFYVFYRYRSDYSERWKGVYDRLRYVPLIERSMGGANLFVRLRQYVGLRQTNMAESLGIDVKKLRELENGRCQPDSELFFMLYEKYDVPPFVLLRDRKGLISELGIILEMMPRDEEGRMAELLCQLHADKEQSEAF